MTRFPTREVAGQIAPSMRVGLLALLRALRRILKASRLLDGLAYGLTCLLLMWPISFFGQGLNWALSIESAWLALALVMFSAVLLLVFAALMTNEQLLREIKPQTIKWPSALSIALAWLAVLVYGGLSCGFERLGVVRIEPSVPYTSGCATSYADLYLWHLFDSIPGIKFTATIGWKQPYTYHDSFSGWLLLSFKVVAVVSVIGSFVVCGRLRRERAINADLSEGKNDIDLKRATG